MLFASIFVFIVALVLVAVWENSLSRPTFGGASLESAVGMLVFSEVDVDDFVINWMGTMCRAGVGGVGEVLGRPHVLLSFRWSNGGWMEKTKCVL